MPCAGDTATQVCGEVSVVDIPLGDVTLVAKLGAIGISSAGTLEATSADSGSDVLILNDLEGSMGLVDQFAHLYIMGEVDTDVGLEMGTAQKPFLHIFPMHVFIPVQALV